MNDKKLRIAGITGFMVAMICCFTPALVLVLAALGLSAWLGWIDYVLFPAMGVFFAVAAYGFWLRRRGATCCAPAGNGKEA